MNKKVGLSFRDFENAENKGFSREGRPTFSAQTIEKERLKCIIENRMSAICELRKRITGGLSCIIIMRSG